MADFLLELLSEEIPARMQEKARDDLVHRLGHQLHLAGITGFSADAFVTPRRLAVMVYGLPDQAPAVSEEIKGPRASAPPQALEGFLRKTGLTREQLVDRDGVLFAVIDRPGRATADVLAEAIPAIVRAFPWPKSMRWGAASAATTALRWVRPLQGIVALLGEDVVPFAIDGIESGATTLGHRFHHPGAVTIGSAADYAGKLRLCHVIVDAGERKAIIRDRAAALAAEAGLSVVPDEGLVAENAGLTEWPVPLLGHFDPDFLSVPREVIQLTLRTNQKYFVLNDGEGKLAPAFICTANIDASDGGAAIVAGNGKVLAARLSDARFFWEQDLKVPLEEWATKLDRIVFHEKLGTVADKVERVAKLARWLVEEGIVRGDDDSNPALSTTRHPGESRGPVATTELDSGFRRNDAENVATKALAQMAEDAARLCKADLVTGMVGEFPELQGVMGGYYARAQGLPDAVADAIRDHYKPVGQGDDVPTAPVTVAVSLADKLDTLVGFFAVGLPPSGSRDPFALRRAALSVISLLIENKLSFAIFDLIRSEYFTSYINHLSGPTNRLDTLKRDMEAFERGGVISSIDLERVVDAISFSDKFKSAATAMVQNAIGILDFFADRLKVQQREAGVRHDLIDAVFALGGEDDLVRLLARVRALQAFVSTTDGANLLAGYKRAANILRIEEKKDGASAPSVTPAEARVQSSAGELDSGFRRNDGEGAAGAAAPSYDPLPEESALVAALDAAEPAAAAAVDAEDFAGAMRALAGLRAPIDAFFEKVTVNDPDPAKRAARLALLARIRDAVHRVADFSKIEG